MYLMTVSRNAANSSFACLHQLVTDAGALRLSDINRTNFLTSTVCQLDSKGVHNGV